MSDSKEPKIVHSEENLIQKKFRYFRDGEYVYYEAYGEIAKVSADGKEAILLYCVKEKDTSRLHITEVKDGYVYFKKSSTYRFESDWQYQAEYTEICYRVKTDESRELQMLSQREDIQMYGHDDYEEGTTEFYDPPNVKENPAKL